MAKSSCLRRATKKGMLWLANREISTPVSIRPSRRPNPRPSALRHRRDRDRDHAQDLAGHPPSSAFRTHRRAPPNDRLPSGVPTNSAPQRRRPGG